MLPGTTTTTARRLSMVKLPVESTSLAATDNARPIARMLWQACEDLRDEALKTAYIQGIRGGNLPPCLYGQYVVQDVAYCVHVQKDYQLLALRATRQNLPTIADFAVARYQGYERYNRNIMAPWHIVDAQAIEPNEAVLSYVAHEHFVASQLHPIYGVVAMIPCERLWSWLAAQLKSSIGANNVYSFWIEENLPSKSAQRLENFVDAWFAANPKHYNHEDAMFAYRGSMLGEVNDFRAATGESLFKPSTMLTPSGDIRSAAGALQQEMAE